jgi:hypothetical protein
LNDIDAIAIPTYGQEKLEYPYLQLDDCYLLLGRDFFAGIHFIGI